MSAGYDGVTAENGVSAVSHLTRTVPNLILTDLNMPQMSRMELISHVRTRYPQISIVAMSADYHGDAVPAGIMADRFYPKGETLQSLLRAIASLIETNPARGGAYESGAQPKFDS